MLRVESMGKPERIHRVCGLLLDDEDPTSICPANTCLKELEFEWGVDACLEDARLTAHPTPGGNTSSLGDGPQ